MSQVVINDETLSGTILNKIEFDWAEEYITVKDLIAQRVKSEVESFNQKSDKPYNGLVVPKKIEKVLNGNKRKENSEKIDIEKQIYVALNGFMENAFFVLVNNKQVEELEEKLLISESTKIAFVQLTPLVGG